MRKFFKKSDQAKTESFVCAAPKGMVFAPFWSENGYSFRGSYGGV